MERSSSIFWGLVVKPSKRYETTVQQAFRISKACLEPSTAKGDISSVFVECDNQEEFIIANLQSKTLNESLDLAFAVGEKISFKVEGPGTVHLTGYIMEDEEEPQNGFMDDFSMEGSEESEDEEEEVKVDKKAKEVVDEGAIKILKRKKETTDDVKKKKTKLETEAKETASKAIQKAKEAAGKLLEKASEKKDSEDEDDDDEEDDDDDDSSDEDSSEPAETTVDVDTTVDIDTTVDTTLGDLDDTENFAEEEDSESEDDDDSDDSDEEGDVSLGASLGDIAMASDDDDSDEDYAPKEEIKEADKTSKKNKKEIKENEVITNGEDLKNKTTKEKEKVGSPKKTPAADGDISKSAKKKKGNETPMNTPKTSKPNVETKIEEEVKKEIEEEVKKEIEEEVKKETPANTDAGEETKPEVAKIEEKAPITEGSEPVKTEKLELSATPAKTPAVNGDVSKSEKKKKKKDKSHMDTPKTPKPNDSSNKETPKVEEKTAKEEVNSKEEKKAKTPKAEEKTAKKEPKTPKTPKEDGKISKDLSTPGKTPKRTVKGGVQIEDLVEGEGTEVSAGKFVGMFYSGKLKTNNKQFDACEKGGKPFKFRVGMGEVIKGWDVGLKGMKPGGKRRLVIPPAMGYGPQGAPPDIPGNSTLVFEVECKFVK